MNAALTPLTPGLNIADGSFVAKTATASKTFKSRRGAVAWLSARGYKADGSRNAKVQIEDHSSYRVETTTAKDPDIRELDLSTGKTSAIAVYRVEIISQIGYGLLGRGVSAKPAIARHRAFNDAFSHGE